jgi:hypothetical protein
MNCSAYVFMKNEIPIFNIFYLGVVLLPMTFLSGTPVECTIHPTLWENMNNEPPDEDYEYEDYEDDVLDSIPKINDSINYVSKIDINHFNEF